MTRNVALPAGSYNTHVFRVFQKRIEAEPQCVSGFRVHSLPPSSTVTSTLQCSRGYITSVLILDGLDKVNLWDISPYLGRELPDNLHIIATIRDTGGINWLSQYGIPKENVTLLSMGGLKQHEIRAILMQAGEKGTRFTNDEIAPDTLLKVTTYEDNPSPGTDPLYIRLLVEDIKEGKISASNIQDQPSG